MINKRKILINSQITATISILETSTNIAFIILLWYFKGTTYFTLLLPLTIYVVILPFAFLSNTSDNKNRIVEEGWKNVIKNMLKFTTKENDNIDDRTNGDDSPSGSTTKTPMKEKKITTISNSSISPKDSSKEDKSMEETSEHPRKSKKDLNFVGLNVKNLEGPYEYYKAKQRLISSMIKCGNNEAKYKKCFKELITIQENQRSENVVVDIEFDDEFTIEPQPFNKSKRKNKGIGKNSKIGHHMNDSQEKALDRCAIDDQSQEKAKQKAELKARMQKRLELLNQIYSLSHDDVNRYNEQIEQLIDLEEMFLQEC